jgi:hypothetical protein
LCHNHRRIHTHPEAHTCLTRVHLHKYRQLYWYLIRMDLRTSRSERMFDTCLSAQIPMDFPMDRKV